MYNLYRVKQIILIKENVLIMNMYTYYNDYYMDNYITKDMLFNGFMNMIWI